MKKLFNILRTISSISPHLTLKLSAVILIIGITVYERLTYGAANGVLVWGSIISALYFPVLMIEIHEDVDKKRSV